jgi:hypothetical protein
MELIILAGKNVLTCSNVNIFQDVCSSLFGAYLTSSRLGSDIVNMYSASGSKELVCDENRTILDLEKVK